MNENTTRSAYALLFLLTTLLGCDDNGRQPTFPVSGKVVFEDGTPLPGGSVICRSESTDGTALSARGQIAEDGRFELSTYETKDGAIEGLHRVAIFPPQPENYDADAGRAPRVIHPRFERPDSSGLEFTVRSDGPNEVELIVSKK